MKILAIESSGLTASAAVMEDDILRSEFTLYNKLTHSETLLPMIDAIFSFLKYEPSDMDAIAVSAGPGSFTGLRIGAATAKGMALALDRPLIRVSSLGALAWNLHCAGDRIICPVMDARRGQVYCGAYYEDLTLIEDGAEDIHTYIERLNALASGKFGTLSGPDRDPCTSGCVDGTGRRADEADGRGAYEAGSRGAYEAGNSGADEADGRGTYEAGCRGADEAGSSGTDEAGCRRADEVSCCESDEARGITEPEFIFLGDGVPVHADTIVKEVKGNVTFADAGSCLQRAASVAALGMIAYRRWIGKNGLDPEQVRLTGASGITCFDDTVMCSDEFVPDYHRRTQAEREMQAGILEDAGIHSLKKIARGDRK